MSRASTQPVRLAIVSCGIALGVVAIVLGFVVLVRPIGISLVAFTLFGLPAFWAAGAVWFCRPTPGRALGHGRFTLLASITLSYLLTALLVTALLVELWMKEPGASRGGNLNTSLTPWAVLFFTGLGIPIGGVCLLFLLGHGVASIWRVMRPPPDDEHRV